MADAALDPLGPKGLLAVAGSLAPLLRAVRVSDCHPHDRDRRVHAAERNHSRNPSAGPNDHAPVDLLAQDAVRRADVVGTLGRDGRRLQPEPRVANRRRRLVHDLVPGRPARSEREVEPVEAQLAPGDVGSENPQGLFEQLLAGLVALEHDDRLRAHRPCLTSRRGADSAAPTIEAVPALPVRPSKRTAWDPESMWLPPAKVGLDQRLRGYNRKLYGSERRMETARITRPLPLRERARPPDRRRAGARATRLPADAAPLPRPAPLGA